jgi:Na+/H+ antiporter NhaC
LISRISLPLYLSLVLVVIPCTGSPADEIDTGFYDFTISAPSFVLRGIDFTIEIKAVDAEGNTVSEYHESATVIGIRQRVDGELLTIDQPFESGSLTISNAVVERTGTVSVQVIDEERDIRSSHDIRSIPGILSILPPILAIGLAILLRQVIISLFAGIWLGAVFIYEYNLLGGIYRVVDHFVVNALSTPSHIMIIIFTMMFGGLVGIISRNGGTLGIANVITRYAKTARGGQFSTWLLSFMIFFDDYANVLIRGNLMRPITDKLKVSREKLSYLVDTGAAAVASTFFISTWIGYQVGLIERGIVQIPWAEDAYSVFLHSIPYFFYSILSLFFALAISLSGRDFGPMLHAERRARLEGKLIRDGAELPEDLTESEILDTDKPARWYNGIIPVVTVLLVACFGIYLTGVQSLREAGQTSYTIGDIVGSSDSYAALIWASFSGCLIGILMSVSQRIMRLKEALDAWFNGLKSMLLAVVILTLAWSIGMVTEELRTADYLVQVLREVLDPRWIPVLTFIIAALTAFATGTSWGTMAILMPIVIPLSYALGVDAGLDVPHKATILYGTVSSVLAGAVFGDHCSPISDTTILSSMASACDHIDHVRTQLPYALVVAFIGMLIGDIPTAYGVSPWISLLFGIAVVFGIVYFFGKKIEDSSHR